MSTIARGHPSKVSNIYWTRCSSRSRRTVNNAANCVRSPGYDKTALDLNALFY